MNQTRVNRLNSICELSTRSRFLQTKLGDHIKDTFGLLELLVRDGIDNSHYDDLAYKIHNFLKDAKRYERQDPEATQPLNTLVYGLTESFATTIQSLIDDRNAQPQQQQYQQQPQQAHQEDEEEPDSPYNTTESDDSEQTLFQTSLLIKEEPMDNEEELVMVDPSDPNVPTNFQHAAALLSFLPHQQPLSTFDVRAQYMADNLSPLNSTHRVRIDQRPLLYSRRDDVDSEAEEEQWNRPSGRTDLTPAIRRKPRLALADRNIVAPVLSSRAFCSPCNMSFTNAGRLSCHNTRMHKGDKPKKAQLKATKKTKKAIAEDVEDDIEAEDPEDPEDVEDSSSSSIVCPECDEPFTARSSLRRHMKRKHKGSDNGVQKSSKPGKSSKKAGQESSFACNVCDMTFLSLRGMNLHTRQIHPSEEKSTVTSMKKLKPTRAMSEAHTRAGFVNCSKCDNRFPNPSSLNCHMRKEHGALPYECTQCGMKFSMKSEQVRHRKNVHE